VPQAAVGVAAVAGERRTPARRRATGRLDEHDVCAELGQHEPGELAAFVGAVDHAVRRQHPLAFPRARTARV
jgi:hypothetical protein